MAESTFDHPDLCSYIYANLVVEGVLCPGPVINLDISSVVVHDVLHESQGSFIGFRICWLSYLCSWIRSAFPGTVDIAVLIEIPNSERTLQISSDEVTAQDLMRPRYQFTQNMIQFPIWCRKHLYLQMQSLYFCFHL